MNIYIVYEITASGCSDNDPTLKNPLFCAVRLTKNADIDKYKYSGKTLDLIEEEFFHFLLADSPAM